MLAQCFRVMDVARRRWVLWPYAAASFSLIWGWVLWETVSTPGYSTSLHRHVTSCSTFPLTWARFKILSFSVFHVTLDTVGKTHSSHLQGKLCDYRAFGTQLHHYIVSDWLTKTSEQSFKFQWTFQLIFTFLFQDIMICCSDIRSTERNSN